MTTLTVNYTFQSQEHGLQKDFIEISNQTPIRAGATQPDRDDYEANAYNYFDAAGIEAFNQITAKCTVIHIGELNELNFGALEQALIRYATQQVENQLITINTFVEKLVQAIAATGFKVSVNNQPQTTTINLVRSGLSCGTVKILHKGGVVVNMTTNKVWHGVNTTIETVLNQFEIDWC